MREIQRTSPQKHRYLGLTLVAVTFFHCLTLSPFALGHEPSLTRCEQEIHKTNGSSPSSIDRFRILLRAGVVRPEFKGVSGYVQYAIQYYGGTKTSSAMQSAFKNVSAVLTKEEMSALDWQQYIGSPEAYLNERSQILQEDQKVRPEFKGLSGYAQYAIQYYGGTKTTSAMQRAFQNVSAVLSIDELSALDWQAYIGSPEAFLKERSQILQEDQKVRPEFKGLSGYAQYAIQYYGGTKTTSAMQKAFKNVSAVLTKDERSALDWQQYIGSPEAFLNEPSQILQEDQDVRPEFKGLSGYAQYASKYYGGMSITSAMQNAFKNVSAVLTKDKMSALDWQQYSGSPEAFLNERSQILDAHQNVRSEFKGLSGYAQYASKYYGGMNTKSAMKNAFANVSAVLTKIEMSTLDWQQYNGSPEAFLKERSQILDAHQNVRSEFKGLSGYVHYASKYYGGMNTKSAMLKTFVNLSAVLTIEEMSALDWQAYSGSPESLLAIREMAYLNDPCESPNTRYMYEGGLERLVFDLCGATKGKLFELTKQQVRVALGGGIRARYDFQWKVKRP